MFINCNAHGYTSLFRSRVKTGRARQMVGSAHTQVDWCKHHLQTHLKPNFEIQPGLPPAIFPDTQSES